ncbi:MAG: hypothetical protein JWP06_1117 [Candidatus Saccharibacteria bacterium]|nr:hypothetical protein [Candidatus Saccharibacteria bacterium]
MSKIKKITRHSLRLWLLSVTIGVGLLFFGYISVQQSLRLGLNDPQVQMAEDIASQLSQGASPVSAIPTGSVDESQSLAPFVTIVNNNIDILASSGKIGDQIPLPPTSAFPDSQKPGNNWFTWQHDKVRDAAVIVPYGNHTGYVLVARSMGQVENTIGYITTLAGLTLLSVLIVPAIIILFI